MATIARTIESGTGDGPAPSRPDTRWLALLIRQGLLLIVAGIEVECLPQQAAKRAAFERWCREQRT